MQNNRHQTKERDAWRVVCASHEPINDHYQMDDLIESYYGHTPEPKNIFLTIRMTHEQMSYLNHTCEQLKMSKSALVKGLIFSLMPE